MSNFLPNQDNASDLGSAQLQFKDLYLEGNIVAADLSIIGNTTVTGNLTVEGTTTTIESITTVYNDPILQVGGITDPTSNDGKDRGISFLYHDGSAAKTGFMGYDNDEDGFTFLKNATINSDEEASGTNAGINCGAVTSIDATNAASLSVINNTITTAAALVDISSTSLTTGAMMRINANTANHDGEILELINAGDATSTGTGLSVTIPTSQVATGISVTMDAITTGDMLYLDNGGGTMTGDGKFINCNDDNASQFSVGAKGLTTITGDASGTDALVLTAGDILVSAGNIDMTVGDMTLADGVLSVTDNVAGAIATFTNGAAGDDNPILVLKNTDGTATADDVSMSFEAHDIGWALGHNGAANTFDLAYNATPGSAALGAGTTALTCTTAGVLTSAAGFTATSGDITILGGNLNITHAAAGATNLVLGTSAGSALANGAINNVIIGQDALNVVTTGDNNTAIGFEALKAQNTDIGNNVAVGSGAGVAITTGTKNVIIGKDAAAGATTADNCVVIGEGTCAATMTGVDNVVIGQAAGAALTGGSNSILINNAGISLTNGINNILLGKDAGKFLETGHNNIGIGTFTLQGIATDSAAMASNVAIGTAAGLNITSGTQNILIGHLAGSQITTGDNNTILGHGATPDADASNQIVIGKGAAGLADNSVVLGNSDVTDVFMAQDKGATVHCGGINTGVPIVMLDSTEVDLVHATHSGRLLVLPTVNQDITLNLPTPATPFGQHYHFIYGGTLVEDHEFIIRTKTTDDSVLIQGSINWTESDSATSGAAIASATEALTIHNAGAIDIHFVAASASLWYVWGAVNSDTAPVWST